MEGLDSKDLLQYRNSTDFAKKHKSIKEDEDVTLLDVIGNTLKRKLEDKIESIQIDWDIWEPDDALKAEAKRRDTIMAHDETRPEISTLKFEPIPREKAEGLKGGFLAMAWNKFVEEIAAGRAEIAEVLVLDYMDAGFNEPKYYFKIADLEGNVFKSGIRKIDYNNLGMVDANHTSIKKPDYVAYFRWEWPEDYMKNHPNRPEDEYKLYNLVFMANGLADKVSTESREHAYVVHFRKGNKDLYGLITKNEYEDLKRIKNYITFMSVDTCFKTDNNLKLDFTW